MNRKTAEQIFAAYERALSNLGEAEVAISQISDPTEQRELIQALTKSISSTLAAQAPTVQQYPEIQPPVPRGEPDTTIDEEDVGVISKLTSVDIAAIDKAILAECAPSWRKVARVVGYALKALQPTLEEVPYGYYAQRVIALENAGLVESQGDLHYIRSSEIRLPQTNEVSS